MLAGVLLVVLLAAWYVVREVRATWERRDFDLDVIRGQLDALAREQRAALAELARVVRALEQRRP